MSTSKKNKKCPKCGADNEQNSKICLACGAKLGNNLILGCSTLIAMFIILIFVIGIIGSSNNESNTRIITDNDSKDYSSNNQLESPDNPESNSNAESESKDNVSSHLALEFGELISVNNGTDGVVVVKAKIKPSYDNKATINQNYYSVCDLIKNHGFDTYSEIQYWAVADMNDGSEAKVISFTLNSNTIKNVYNGSIVENQLGDYVDDLYILPSLKN